jgi:hypothetical protein
MLHGNILEGTFLHANTAELCLHPYRNTWEFLFAANSTVKIYRFVKWYISITTTILDIETMDTADYTSAKWLRYVYHTFVVWPHGPVRLQQFLQQAYHKFTTQVEDDNTIPFLDVLVMKRGPKLATKIYRKPAYTDRYLHFKSSHPHHIKEELFT